MRSGGRRIKLLVIAAVVIAVAAVMVASRVAVMTGDDVVVSTIY